MYRQFENTIIPCISTLSPRKTLLSSGWKELRQDKKEPFIVLCLSRNQAFSTMLIAKHNHSLKWRPLKASHFNCTFSRLFDLQTYVPPGPCGLVLPKAFSSYDRSFDVICLSTFLYVFLWSQTWFIVGPMNSFFRALWKIYYWIQFWWCLLGECQLDWEAWYLILKIRNVWLAILYRIPSIASE